MVGIDRDIYIIYIYREREKRERERERELKDSMYSRVGRGTFMGRERNNGTSNPKGPIRVPLWHYKAQKPCMAWFS